MKSNNSILHQVVFSFKSASSIRNSYHFTLLLTAFFLFISLVSFSGEIKNNTAALSFYGNCSSVLKASTSPLTGTKSLRTNLYLLNDNNSTILADGVLAEYNNLYHDSVYLEDAYKFTNSGENLGLIRYGAVLAIERRPVISTSDTLFFKLWKTTLRNYQFEFVTINLYHPGMQAFLEDAYLGTRTLIALGGTTKMNFSVNTNAASANVNRFRIVYQTTFAAVPLPVAFTSFKGYQQSNIISIDWKVENEINIEKYDVERSLNGTDFIKVNSIAVDGINSAYNSYSWIDDNPFNGINFYRIKSVCRDGSKKNSLIIKVTYGKTGAGYITIYPNPIEGNMVNLQFTNQPTGIYQVRMINNNGQVVYSGRLHISSGNISQTLFTDKKLAGGIYQLEIKAPNNTVYIRKAIVQI